LEYRAFVPDLKENFFLEEPFISGEWGEKLKYQETSLSTYAPWLKITSNTLSASVTPRFIFLIATSPRSSTPSFGILAPLLLFFPTSSAYRYSLRRQVTIPKSITKIWICGEVTWEMLIYQNGDVDMPGA
jgi:hypothetical protein